VTVERIDGPTPAGGVYALAFFCDEDLNPAAPAEAAQVIVSEYDAADRLLAEHVFVRGERAGAG
jgi:hypothetical protein